MKKILCVILAGMCFVISACADEGKKSSSGEEQIMYEQITAKKAKEIMDSKEDSIILDVREKEEYDEGHIPGAVLLPYTDIENKAEQMLPDKEKLILVYCRTGRRSKIAAESLVKLGYTNIKEFGGITDWPYETESRG